ncbi:MAG TPA: hypothetical protein VGP15_18355, partial [Burkholderiales bacterium]|nr:hypothetical protein [Burkholderiales bacterium]
MDWARCDEAIRGSPLCLPFRRWQFRFARPCSGRREHPLRYAAPNQQAGKNMTNGASAPADIKALTFDVFGTVV